MLLAKWYELPLETRGDKNESELWVELYNGARIVLKGADNEDSLRGLGLKGIVVDEVASIRNWNYLWKEVLRPALTDKKGWGIFISTPKGFNHFYDLFNQEAKDQDFQSFRFTTYDNPYLSHEEIDKAKLELGDNAFAQEYLADFRKYTGLVYPQFDRTTHIIEDTELDPKWRYYRAMDFGAVNPTVCLWIAVDNNDSIYIFDEYYNTGQTTEFHANVIKYKTSKDYSVVTTFGDPSGNQQMMDYASFEVYIAPANKTYAGSDDWVISGIKKVQLYLTPDGQTKRPRLYVFKKCQNVIREFETYRWIETIQGEQIKDKVEKVDDHCMDALRYFVVSYEPEKKDDRLEWEIKQYQPNSYTGY